MFPFSKILTFKWLTCKCCYQTGGIKTTNFVPWLFLTTVVFYRSEYQWALDKWKRVIFLKIWNHFGLGISIDLKEPSFVELVFWLGAEIRNTGIWRWLYLEIHLGLCHWDCRSECYINSVWSSASFPSEYWSVWLKCIL